MTKFSRLIAILFQSPDNLACKTYLIPKSPFLLTSRMSR
jgi:hypothetical protein